MAATMDVGVSKDPVEAYFWETDWGRNMGKEKEHASLSGYFAPEQFAAVTKRKAVWISASPSKASLRLAASMKKQGGGRSSKAIVLKRRGPWRANLGRPKLMP